MNKEIKEETIKKPSLWGVVSKAFCMVWMIVMMPVIYYYFTQMMLVTKIATLPIIALTLHIIVTLAMFLNLYKGKK